MMIPSCAGAGHMHWRNGASVFSNRGSHDHGVVDDVLLLIFCAFVFSGQQQHDIFAGYSVISNSILSNYADVTHAPVHDVIKAITMVLRPSPASSDMHIDNQERLTILPECGIIVCTRAYGPTHIGMTNDQYNEWTTCGIEGGRGS